MLNALIVVWRESLEAMLVIGVLLAWIARQPEPAALRLGVWTGCAAGVVLALVLGAAAFLAQSQFAGLSLEIFQLVMVLFAAALMVQMVFWMHRHGRQMKQQLEARAGHSGSIWGVASITALAVGREGAETVVFIYGLGLQAGGAQLLGLLAAVAAGMALAGATAWLVARGARFLNYRTLFRVSEILLLLMAGALLAHGIDRMIALDWLPLVMDPVWDTSRWMDDAQGAGSVLASFLGYRAKPSGTLLLALLAYWLLALWRLKKEGARVR